MCGDASYPGEIGFTRFRKTRWREISRYRRLRIGVDVAKLSTEADIKARVLPRIVCFGIGYNTLFGALLHPFWYFDPARAGITNPCSHLVLLFVFSQVSG
jgi:hypothetical protein